MKTTFTRILPFALIALLAAGCVTDSGDDDDDNGNGAATISAFFPAPIVGPVATMQVKRTVYPSAIETTTTITAQVTGPVVRDGNSVYTIVRSESGNQPIEFFFASNALFFRVDESLFEGYDIGTSENSPLGYDHKFFDFSLAEGASYTVLEGGFQTEAEYVNIDIDAVYLGVQTVQVPAGTYSDARAFRLTTTLRYTPKVTGTVREYSRVETYWFGRGAGTVKRTVETSAGSFVAERVVEELTGIAAAE